MKYDIERFESDLLALVKLKLPDKLTEISTEKGDGITLVVPVDADYFSSTDDEVLNRKILVQHGVIDGKPTSLQSNTAEENRYMFLIYLNEQNNKPGISRSKVLRYTRALKEIFEENFDRFPCVSNISVQTIAPVSAGFDENEISPVYKVGGVYIETSLAS